jgi:hypothetical protein
MRECKRQGCRVFLLTAEKLRDADWPRESLDDIFYLPADLPLADIVKAVTHLARSQKIDRIVALDEFDMETASTLREHLRVPGMGSPPCAIFATSWPCGCARSNGECASRISCRS